MPKPRAMRPWGGRHRWLPAALAAALCVSDPALACSRGLVLASFPDGAKLNDVELTGASWRDGKDNYDFALVYVHSVTLTPVESRYRLAGGEIRQVAELFSEHGPGLATEPAAGAPPWRREDGRFLVTLDRSLPRIVLRVDPEYRNRLVAAGVELDLTQWGRRALELRPKACDGRSG